MEPTEAVQMLFHLMGGLGLFLLGAGVMWFVSVYREIHGDDNEESAG